MGTSGAFACKVKQWWASILMLLLILWLTLAPKPTGEVSVSLFPGADKLLHAGMFCVLAFLILRDRSRLGKRHSATLRASVCVWAAVTLLGGIIELLQETMQLGRTFEWCDILADSAGALAGAAAAMIIFRQPSE